RVPTISVVGMNSSGSITVSVAILFTVCYHHWRPPARAGRQENPKQGEHHELLCAFRLVLHVPSDSTSFRPGTTRLGREERLPGFAAGQYRSQIQERGLSPHSARP